MSRDEQKGLQGPKGVQGPDLSAILAEEMEKHSKDWNMDWRLAGRLAGIFVVFCFMCFAIIVGHIR